MLASWKKSCDQPRQHIKRQRHFFADKRLSSQSLGFSSSHVWMWELDCKESWVPKSFDAFEPWCWRYLLRVPWTTRRSSQSILKEISPGCPLESLMLKLKLKICSQLLQRTDSFEKTLMLGIIEGGRRRGQQRMRWLDGITDSKETSLSRLWELLVWQGSLLCCSSWSRKELEMTEQLYWTELNFWCISSQQYRAISLQLKKKNPHSSLIQSFSVQDV